ncbi:MAG TPA: PP0621 family protein [Burkholderiales bacterium]|nr:PP0621 family protein [Burkholderiales bacterium]
MAKLLLLVAVFTVVYLILRNYKRRIDKSEQPPGQAQTDGTSKHGASKHGTSKHGEDMVRCRVCGIHLPKSEAITSRGDIFCTREHLQIADRERDGR